MDCTQITNGDVVLSSTVVNGLMCIRYSDALVLLGCTCRMPYDCEKWERDSISSAKDLLWMTYLKKIQAPVHCVPCIESSSMDGLAHLCGIVTNAETFPSS
jgi:hypothetical protein